MLDVARNANVPIAVYIWPELTRPLGASPNDALIDRLGEICLGEKIECVDLRPALRSEKKHERLIVNRFDTHASAEANAMAADLLLVRFDDRWRTAAGAQGSADGRSKAQIWKFLDMRSLTYRLVTPWFARVAWPPTNWRYRASDDQGKFRYMSRVS